MATFGDTALTGTTALSIENVIAGGYFQMGATGGTGNSITAKLTIGTAAHNCKCALYNADESLVANSTTEEITVPVQLATATTFNFGATKPVLVASAWYYIVVWAEATTGDAWISYGAKNGSGVFSDTETYNGFPATFAAGVVDADGLFAGYCTYSQAFTQALADTMAISDSSSAAATYNVPIADTLSIGDSLAAAAKYNVALADNLAINDSTAGGVVMTFRQAISDTLTISDATAAAATYRVALADNLSISDSMEAAAAYVVALADTMNISDAMIAVVGAVKKKLMGATPRKIGWPTPMNVGVGA